MSLLVPRVRIKDIRRIIGKITRVKIIGKVINKLEEPDSKLSRIIIHDGTGTIEVRIYWTSHYKSRIVNSIKKGDYLLVIGSLREWEKEVYVIADIARVISEKLREYYDLRLMLIKDNIK